MKSSNPFKFRTFKNPADTINGMILAGLYQSPEGNRLKVECLWSGPMGYKSQVMLKEVGISTDDDVVNYANEMSVDSLKAMAEQWTGVSLMMFNPVESTPVMSLKQPEQPEQPE